MFTALKQFDPSKAECGTDELMQGRGGSQPATKPGDVSPSKSNRGAWLENFVIPSAYAGKKASRAPASAITIEDRIADCAKQPGSTVTTKAGVDFNLVARRRHSSTGRFYEVWKDTKTGLLWGDRLDSTYSHYNTVELAASPCTVNHNAPNWTKNCPVVSEKACSSDEGKRANAGIGEKSFGVPTIQEFIQAEKDGVREAVPNMKNYWFWSSSLSSDGSVSARDFSGDSGNFYVGSRDDGVYFSVRCVAR